MTDVIPYGDDDDDDDDEITDEVYHKKVYKMIAASCSLFSVLT